MTKIAPHDSCRMVISGINARVYDRMSYYDLWHAGVILAAMCARTGKAGLFRHIGEYQARRSKDAQIMTTVGLILSM